MLRMLRCRRHDALMASPGRETLKPSAKHVADAAGGGGGPPALASRREKPWEAFFRNLLEHEVSLFNGRWNKKASSNDKELANFEKLKTLGTGGFGRVMLVRSKKNDRYYAMKILKREKVVRLRQVQHTLNEKRILSSCNYPFVVTLYSSHKDNSYLYFVLEFVNGGELFTLLRRMKNFPEAMVQFYSSQVVLAFEYLHAVGIVYRDLKPENLLVDRKGYLKVTDMGLAKRLKEGITYTMCGTPEYLAPEVIQSKGYGKGVDWWAVGILIYEMYVGQVPFYARDHMVMYARIVSGSFHMDSKFSDPLKHLLKNLIQVDWTRRYGCMRNGVIDIKQHKWFAAVDWIALYEGKLPAPHVPTSRSPGDASNFDEYDEESMTPSATESYASEFEDF